MLVRRIRPLEIARPEQQHFMALASRHPRKSRVIVAVDKSVGAISGKPRVADESLVDVFAGHALEWIPPQNAQRSKLFSNRWVAQITHPAVLGFPKKPKRILSGESAVSGQRQRISRSTNSGRRDLIHREKNQCCRAGRIQARRAGDPASLKRPRRFHSREPGRNFSTPENQRQLRVSACLFAQPKSLIRTACLSSPAIETLCHKRKARDNREPEVHRDHPGSTRLQEVFCRRGNPA